MDQPASTELLCVSDSRQTHKDIPTSLDTALKYTDGAKLGVGSCLVSVTDGYIQTLAGEIQYGNKRYTVAEYSTSPIPYCYGDGVGGVGYVAGTAIPCLWDDPRSPTPQRIPEGYYANYWLYAALSADIELGTPEEMGVAKVFIVLGNTLHLTEREAKSEIVPATKVVPVSGVVANFEDAGNIVPFARVTVGVTIWGDGPIYTTSISQPMSFGLDVPPRPEIKDIPYSSKYIALNNDYTVTVDDRNRDIAIAHYVEEGVNGTLITLPAAADFGVGYWVNILSLSSYSLDSLAIECDGSEVITWPKDSNAAYLETYSAYSSVRLVCTGFGWVATDFSGKWYDSQYGMLFDGCIPSGTEDNIVTIDADGNAQDSGVAIGDIGGTGSSPTVNPQTGSYPVVVGDANNTVFVMDSASAATFTLEASPATNRYLIFVNKGAGACTVAGNSKLIGADASVILGTYESITLIYDGTKWLAL